MAVPATTGAALSTWVPEGHEASVSSQEKGRVKEIPKEGPQGGSEYVKEEILPSLPSGILIKHLK